MIYDVVIVGGGPSGLTAGIYACRAKLNVLLIEKMAIGGAVNFTYDIKNYPGFESISGAELIEKMYNQAKINGVNFTYDEVLDYDLNNDVKKIICRLGTFYAKSVILCNGASNKKLGLKNEEKFVGSGVSYCAICDGAFFRSQNVAVVGGGNTAMEDAIYLSKTANKVYVVCRKDKLVADQILKESAFAIDNIQFLFNTEVKSINGTNRLENITIFNNKNNEESILDVEGLFVAIGRKPDTENLKNHIKLTDKGYIVTNQDMETSVKGVFACGDVREKSVRQIITACSDGAVASTKANQYLSEKKEV